MFLSSMSGRRYYAEIFEVMKWKNEEYIHISNDRLAIMKDEGYNFCGYCGFWGLPQNLFCWKLVEILSWYRLQTEEKTPK